MRLRHIAVGCALTGALGSLALTPAAAQADTAARPGGGTTQAGGTARPGDTAKAGHDTAKAGHDTAHADHTARGHPTEAGQTARGHAPHAARPAQPTTPKASPTATPTATPTPPPAKTKPLISVTAPTNNSYAAKVKITVTLKQAVADHEVSLYATPLGQARKLVATGTVDAQGKWYPTYKLTRATTFTAVFAGDAHNDPVSASRTLNAFAGVANRITGSTSTSKSSSGIVYDVFHAKATLTLYATVTPNKQGECLQPETQQYDQGVGWDADTKYGCDKLNSGSKDTAPFTLSQAVGDRYRIRADYVRSSSDTANLSEQGPWLYFIVSK